MSLRAAAGTPVYYLLNSIKLFLGCRIWRQYEASIVWWRRTPTRPVFFHRFCFSVYTCEGFGVGMKKRFSRGMCWGIQNWTTNHHQSDIIFGCFFPLFNPPQIEFLKDSLSRFNPYGMRHTHTWTCWRRRILFPFLKSFFPSWLKNYKKERKNPRRAVLSNTVQQWRPNGIFVVSLADLAHSNIVWERRVGKWTATTTVSIKGEKKKKSLWFVSTTKWWWIEEYWTRSRVWSRKPLRARVVVLRFVNLTFNALVLRRGEVYRLAHFFYFRAKSFIVWRIKSYMVL